MNKDFRASLADAVSVRKASLWGRRFDLDSSETDAWIEVSLERRKSLPRGFYRTVEGVSFRFHEIPGGPSAQLVLRNHGLTRIIPLIE